MAALGGDKLSHTNGLPLSVICFVSSWQQKELHHEEETRSHTSRLPLSYQLILAAGQ